MDVVSCGKHIISYTFLTCVCRLPSRKSMFCSGILMQLRPLNMSSEFHFRRCLWGNSSLTKWKRWFNFTFSTSWILSIRQHVGFISNISFISFHLTTFHKRKTDKTNDCVAMFFLNASSMKLDRSQQKFFTIF